MVCFTREEILEKLLDFNILTSRMIMYPDSKIKDLYSGILYEKLIRKLPYDENIYGFETMMRIQRIMSILRMFSYYEESYIDSLTDSNIDFSPFKKNIKDGGIFIDGNGKKFSNKQIIRYIRDAFNHNDSDSFSKVNISKNAKYIEINLRGVDFHIKISSDQLLDMSSEIVSSAESLYLGFLSNEKGDILERLVMPKKVSTSILNEVGDISTDTSLTKDNKVLKIKELFDKNGLPLNIKEYPLDQYQMKTLNKYKSILKGKHDFLIDELIPHGMEKDYFEYCNILFLYLFGLNKSYNDIKESALNICDNKPSSSMEKDINACLEDKIGRYLFVTYVGRNSVQRWDITNTLFYAFNNGFVNDELKLFDEKGNQISFEDDTLSLKDHIRNSLTHGWYFLNHDCKYEMYDNSCRQRDDYNFYTHATIDRVDLFNSVIRNRNVPFLKAAAIEDKIKSR